MSDKVKVDGVLRPKTATDLATARLLREVARASDDRLDGDTRTAAWNLAPGGVRAMKKESGR